MTEIEEPVKLYRTFTRTAKVSKTVHKQLYEFFGKACDLYNELRDEHLECRSLYGDIMSWSEVVMSLMPVDYDLTKDKTIRSYLPEFNSYNSDTVKFTQLKKTERYSPLGKYFLGATRFRD